MRWVELEDYFGVNLDIVWAVIEKDCPRSGRLSINF